MVRSVQIVLTFIIQLADGSEAQPDWDQVLGAAVVLATIMVMALEKKITSKLKCGTRVEPEEAPEGIDPKKWEALFVPEKLVISEYSEVSLEENKT
jgi:hypothetical protein